MNTNLKNQYEIVESILKKLNFTTKEEVVEYAETLYEVVSKNDDYSEEVKADFEGALQSLANLTLQEMKNIKKFLF